MRKQCCTCKHVKDAEAFAFNAGSSDGRATQCKECKHEYDLKRYQEKRDQMIQSSAKWKAAHPEAHRESVRISRRRKKTGLPLRVRKRYG